MNAEIVGTEHDSTSGSPAAISEKRRSARESFRSAIAVVLAVDCLLLGLVIVGAVEEPVFDSGRGIRIEAVAPRLDDGRSVAREASVGAVTPRVTTMLFPPTRANRPIV